MADFIYEDWKKATEEPLHIKSVPVINSNKWEVKGYTIMRAQEAVDDLSGYIMLTLDGHGETGTPYVLRMGDLPGLPFAEELDREIKEGLIEIEPPDATSKPA